jgi:ADP-ribose pyrophosphatase
MTFKTVFRTPWLVVEEVSVKSEREGTQEPYYVIRNPTGVICCPLTRDGKFLLVRQFRPAMQRYTLEFPAGSVEGNETPAEAVRREVLEETGFALDALVPVGGGYIRLNRDINSDFFYIGLGAHRVTDIAEHEATEVVLSDRVAFRELVASDGFEQTVAVAILAMAELKFGVNLYSEPMQPLLERLTGLAQEGGP